MPLTFRGKAQIPNVGINAVGKPAIDDRQAKLIKQMYAHSDLASAGRGRLQGARRRLPLDLGGNDRRQPRRGIARGFELSARRIGRLMRDQYNLGFVDVGGWDTHVNQGAAQGYLADRLGELGRGLAGFAEESARPGTTPSW